MKIVLRILAFLLIFPAIWIFGPAVSPKVLDLEYTILSEIACNYRAPEHCYAMFQVLKKTSHGESLGERACAKDIIPACSGLADLYVEKGQDAMAARTFSKLCQLGDSSACAEAGLTQYTSGDKAAAIQDLKARCEQGSESSCTAWFAIGRHFNDNTALFYGAHYGCHTHLNPVLCAELGRLQRGWNREPQAQTAFLTGCRLGDKASCESYKQFYPTAPPLTATPNGLRALTVWNQHAEVHRKKFAEFVAALSAPELTTPQILAKLSEFQRNSRYLLKQLLMIVPDNSVGDPHESFVHEMMLNRALVTAADHYMRKLDSESLNKIQMLITQMKVAEKDGKYGITRLPASK